MKPTAMYSRTNIKSVSQKWFSAFSFIIATVLFIIITWYVFAKTTTDTIENPTALTSTTTSIRIDSSSKATGRKVIIDTTIVTRPAEVPAAPAAEEGVNKKLTTAFNYFLLLFGVFIILSILPRIKNLNFGKDGVSAEFYEIAKAINEAQSQTAQTPQLPQGGKTQTSEMKLMFLEEKTKLVNDTGALDPQKDKWGGKPEHNYRKLSAIISRITGSEWAEIILKVESTDSKTHPLRGIVTFHLHPTFINPSPVIIVLNGVAELKIKAWGAFTVGAVADGGVTMLELDLQGQPGSFEPFNSR